MAEKKKEMTFESAMARLEEIVRTMENGAAPLDRSLALFEEGVGLVKYCSEMLDNAEQKVKILQKGEDGTFSEANFTGASEA